jgi:hypothetical protein
LLKKEQIKLDGISYMDGHLAISKAIISFIAHRHYPAIGADLKPGRTLKEVDGGRAWEEGGGQNRFLAGGRDGHEGRGERGWDILVLLLTIYIVIRTAIRNLHNTVRRPPDLD